MLGQKVLAGTVHNRVPTDIKRVLTAHTKALAIWNTLTPLARNEWICWVEGAKLIETRKSRVERAYKELIEGKRRPCCWIGCIHRKDKAISPSVRWILEKQSKLKKK